MIAAACVALALVALVRVTSLGSLVEQNSIQTRGFYGSFASPGDHPDWPQLGKRDEGRRRPDR